MRWVRESAYNWGFSFLKRAAMISWTNGRRCGLLSNMRNNTTAACRLAILNVRCWAPMERESFFATMSKSASPLASLSNAMATNSYGLSTPENFCSDKKSANVPGVSRAPNFSSTIICGELISTSSGWVCCHVLSAPGQRRVLYQYAHYPPGIAGHIERFF